MTARICSRATRTRSEQPDLQGDIRIAWSCCRCCRQARCRANTCTVSTVAKSRCRQTPTQIILWLPALYSGRVRSQRCCIRYFGSGCEQTGAATVLVPSRFVTTKSTTLKDSSPHTPSVPLAKCTIFGILSASSPLSQHPGAQLLSTSNKTERPLTTASKEERGTASPP